MDVRSLDGKHAMVTGAANGIGRATALALAERGAQLFICDVDTPGLEKVQEAIEAFGQECMALRVDVSRSDEFEDFAAAVHSRIDAVDVLVNNAGVGVLGLFAETPLDDLEWILGVNLKGVIYGCHFFVPSMISAGRGGHVVNVASMAAYMPSAGMTAYAASKYGVLGFSESLRHELAADGIGVSAVCPGITDTAIWHATRIHGAVAAEATRQRLTNAYRRRDYTPKRVAAGILSAIQHNRRIAPISAEAWGGYWLKRLTPWLFDRIGRTTATILRKELGK